jgi:hypothetical protein
MMVKLIAKLMAGFLVYLFSPTWMLLSSTLEGYFDLNRAVQGPQEMLLQFEHFNAMVLLYPTEVFYVLFPKLILIVLCSIAFAVGFTYVCGRLLSGLGNRLRPLMHS